MSYTWEQRAEYMREQRDELKTEIKRLREQNENLAQLLIDYAPDAAALHLRREGWTGG